MNKQNIRESIAFLKNLPVKNLVHPKQGVYVGPRNHQLVCPLMALARQIDPLVSDSPSLIEGTVKRHLGITGRMIDAIVATYDTSRTKGQGRRAVIRLLEERLEEC